MSKPRVRVYLDGSAQPVIDAELPSAITLDTRNLEDGPHRLVIRAADEDGREGYEEIPFRVENGPGVVVAGLQAHSIRRGTIHFTVDAFSTDDAFDPRRAEARSLVPVWVWVMSLFIVAWAAWYAARTWNVPAEYADTPTYRSSTPAPKQ